MTTRKNSKPKSEAKSLAKEKPRYRKIDPRIWNDWKFNRLSTTGQFLFLYLLTHSNLTSIGLLKVKKESLAYERDWDIQAFNLAFDLASQLGLIEYDECGLICLPNYIKYNEPESLTVVKSWSKARAYIPECPLFYKQVERLKKYCKERGKNFLEAFYWAFPDADKFQNIQEDTQLVEAMVKPNGESLFEPNAEANSEPKVEPNSEPNSDSEVSLGVRDAVTKELRTKILITTKKEIEKEKKSDFNLLPTDVSKPKKSRKKPVVDCPFQPNEKIPDDYLEVANEYGIKNPQLVFEKFVNYCLSTGKQYADHKAAFRNFCIREVEWSSNKAAPLNGPPPAAPVQADDYADYFDENGKVRL